jgi:hypothetical protein
MRLPLSAKIVLARAGARVGTLTSPTPLGDSVGAARAEDDLAPRGCAQPSQQAAFHLGADQIEIEHNAAVERKHDAVHVDASAIVD